MSEKREDVKIVVGKGMNLTVKEVRGSSTTHTYKEGYQEVASSTRTHFHWKLCGIASKLEVGSEGFDTRKQEVYHIAITSETYGFGYGSGFGSREGAIRNALQFAVRNGMEVDGYQAAKESPGDDV